MTHTKAEWRERLLRARRLTNLEARRAASAAIVERIAGSQTFASARSVRLYAAIGAEIDPAALEPLAWSAGKDVYRPATSDPLPSWALVEPPEGTLSVQVPRSPVACAAPSLVVVPGLGFDPTGTRLGRGLGYYDRAIAALRRDGEVTVVGVALDLQVVSELPRDPWDHAVDLVVTERRVLICRETPAARSFGGAR
jgi:5-formyltetrahydrofolate cyclo-ligase